MKKGVPTGHPFLFTDDNESYSNKLSAAIFGTDTNISLSVGHSFTRVIASRTVRPIEFVNEAPR